MYGLDNLMIKVSIWSKPKELELLSPEMTFSTSSGCTAEKEKEQGLPTISLLKAASGSMTGGGRFSLISEILSRKKLFCASATS